MRILFILAFLMLAMPAYAQSVDETRCACTPKEASTRWYEADAIFAGTVQSIKIIDKYVQYGTEDLPAEVVLLVDDAYKNVKVGDTFTLHTSLTRKTCTGHPFEVWKKYMVFAYERKQETFELWSLYNFPSGTYDVGGLCGGTKSLTDPAATQDMKDLKKKLEPEKKKPSIQDRLLKKWRTD